MYTIRIRYILRVSRSVVLDVNKNRRIVLFLVSFYILHFSFYLLFAFDQPFFNQAVNTEVITGQNFAHESHTVGDQSASRKCNGNTFVIKHKTKKRRIMNRNYLVYKTKLTEIHFDIYNKIMFINNFR